MKGDMEPSKPTEALALLQKNLDRVILGKSGATRLAVVCLLAGGHLLIEDIPGVGKTTLARALARSLDGKFQRIQFTPDLLPSDITGISVYDQDEKAFVFKPGPLFANIILADEINRTTPRTQSALLEAMNVGTVTVDSTTHTLPQPFMVIATQNPLEFTGTYPLPESQMDRFLMKIELSYPSRKAEKAILLSRRLSDPLAELASVLSVAQAGRLIDAVRLIRMEEPVVEYLTRIVEETRKHPDLALGASPRASLGLFRAAQSLALVSGRDFALPDDIKKMAVSVLAHRLLMKDQVKSSAASEAASNVVLEILETVPVPL